MFPNPPSSRRRGRATTAGRGVFHGFEFSEVKSDWSGFSTLKGPRQFNERLDRARRLQALLAATRRRDLIFLKNDAAAGVIKNDPKMRKHLATELTVDLFVAGAADGIGRPNRCVADPKPFIRADNAG